MKDTNRYPAELALQLARAFDEMPACKNHEVSAAQAVQLLAPQIRGLRAKGYSIDAILSLLAERGIVTTPAALRANLRRAETARGGSAAQKRKNARPSPKRAAPHSATDAAIDGDTPEVRF